MVLEKESLTKVQTRHKGSVEERATKARYKQEIKSASNMKERIAKLEKAKEISRRAVRTSPVEESQFPITKQRRAQMNNLGCSCVNRPLPSQT